MDPVIEMPRGMEVSEHDGPAPAASGGDPYRSAGEINSRPTLTIRWRTDSKGGWFLVLWSVVWWGILTPIILSGEASWWISGHVLAGIGTAFVMVRQFVNRTTVTAADGTLSSTIGPLPPKTRMTVRATEIRQIYAERVAGETKESDRHIVNVLTTDGHDRNLVTVDTAEQARWIEQRLERHLGLLDEPVPGELPKS